MEVMEAELPAECTNIEVEASPALISLHPLGKSIVLAVGSELRIFDLEANSPVSLTDEACSPSHSDAIRAISFGANGKLFVSAGDDKLVKLWRTDIWRCVKTVYSDKRVSAVAISHDGLFVTFADKFGVVWIEGLEEDGERNTSINKRGIPLLGHYCSIITSLVIAYSMNDGNLFSPYFAAYKRIYAVMKFSPNGQFIATADRDFKIRITIFPKEPLKGAHEIQSFCLGHTDFVTCLAFICFPDCYQSLLLSGSGDGTVRLWDHVSGCLLNTCDVRKKVKWLTV